MSQQSRDTSNDIAIVGMDGRFPGAPNLEQFWRNLRDGVESVTFASDTPPVIANGTGHVKAAPLLDGIELFDAAFFGFNPREAEGMDPQVRLFLEVAWSALESAGLDPAQYAGRIGVFAGCAMSTYFNVHLLPNPEAVRGGGGALSSFGQLNDRDSLATIASYKLDLTGPSVTVQTFCSTSLVAVHMACQSLLGGESDAALAGASSINVALQHGYMYQEGGILSKDGHTRTFDADASGTVFGNGVGVVVLKRLADALRDRDVIRGVIRGSAINNDGAQKAGYTAPSVGGQSRAIAEAIAVAQVEPDEIGYVEAHGTATAVGDPIEIEALTRAFRTGTARKSFCPIGAAKTNFGHLDRAAGMAALMKTVLSLEHRQIPPTLHFKSPNPKIDFANSPFYVNTTLADWKTNGAPRVAGISALGVGGTNAHVIVEEAPAVDASGPSRPAQLIVLSARTESALESQTARLAAFLRHHPEVPLADAAYTLLHGRHRFEHRRALVAESHDAAAAALESNDARRVTTLHSRATDRPVAFLFPGQGAQYVGMARDLYEREAVFKKSLDDCFTRLTALGLDLKPLLFADPSSDAAAARLRETAIAQPALFAVECALAQQWMAWGITPFAMIGHSVGEYVAAHLAGVFSLEDALRLVVERGRLMQSMPAGSMMAIPASLAQVQPLLTPGLEIAAVNAPSLCVVAGPAEAIDALELRLEEQGLLGSRLHTSHAFHTAMMEPILAPFRAVLSGIRRSAPKIPYVSNLTGTWITAAQAMDEGYWTDHLRRTVRFSEGVETLWAENDCVLLEVGPGQTLSTLARQHAAAGTSRLVVTSIRHPRETESDVVVLLSALGRLWAAGVAVDAAKIFAGEKRRRALLPTYAFDRKKYWIEAPVDPFRASRSGKRADVGEWTYLPTWRSSLPAGRARRGKEALRGGAWLVFADERGLADKLVPRLRDGGAVVTVCIADTFGGDVHSGFRIRPAVADDYERLLAAIGDAGIAIDHVVHGWSVGPTRTSRLDDDAIRLGGERGYYSLFHLAKAMVAKRWTQKLHLHVLTSEAQAVFDADALHPEKATLLGLAKVIPQELHNLTCSSVDVDEPSRFDGNDRAVAALVDELRAAESGAIVAYRAGQRFVQDFAPLPLAAPADRPARVRERGVYLITGGLGGVTFILAAYLAYVAKARLILSGRARLPERSEWPGWIAAHGEADPISQRIRRVLSLEEWGAEVLLVSADVAHEDEMRAAVREGEARFGPVQGVIHGAGVVGGKTFRPLEQLGADDCESQFHPKVTGLVVLERVLAGKALDFCLLTSSLSSVLGGYAYGAYAAANVFMDAFAQDVARRTGAPWISVNWDEWRLSEEAAARPAGLANFAMAPTEGAAVFARILDGDVGPQVVVSSGDLNARIVQWVRLEALRGAKPGAKETESKGTRHPRPNLQNAYVAPSNPTEEKVAGLWADFLGVEKVGTQDNFFDIGGHSLLAIQVITAIRNELKAEIAVASLFEGPTVESLCRIIAGSGASEGFTQSSDRGRKRKEERQRRQVERYQEPA